MSNPRTGPAFGSFDPDYGPYTGAAADPRTPEPPYWDEMTDEQKRAELLTLSQTELADMVLGLAEEVVSWERRAARARDLLGAKP